MQLDKITRSKIYTTKINTVEPAPLPARFFRSGQYISHTSRIFIPTFQWPSWVILSLTRCQVFGLCSPTGFLFVQSLILSIPLCFPSGTSKRFGWSRENNFVIKIPTNFDEINITSRHPIHKGTGHATETSTLLPNT